MTNNWYIEIEGRKIILKNEQKKEFGNPGDVNLSMDNNPSGWPPPTIAQINRARKTLTIWNLGYTP